MDLGVKSVVLLGIALGLIQAQIAESQGAPPDKWYARSSKPRDFETPRGLPGKFAIELPKRDWQIVPGYGGVEFMATEKAKNNQAAVAVMILDHMQLRSPIGPKDVDAGLAEIESSLVRGQAGGQKVEQQVKEAEGRKFIFIQYSKPGLSGPDRVVQYSIPVGAVMYRLICIAPEAQLNKYQEIFAHAAASFKAS